MQAKCQFLSSGQTSENPGQNFSEVGTQLLRAPQWSISAHRLEPPSSQTQPKSIYVVWVAMDSLQTLSSRVAKVVRVAKSMLQSSLQPLTWPTPATLRGPARPLLCAPVPRNSAMQILFMCHLQHSQHVASTHVVMLVRAVDRYRHLATTTALQAYGLLVAWLGNHGCAAVGGPSGAWSVPGVKGHKS